MAEAMVKSPPEKTKALIAAENRLAELLQVLGNNRAYTLIRYHANSWKVMFEGDYHPSTIKIVDGQPVIMKELEL